MTWNFEEAWPCENPEEGAYYYLYFGEGTSPDFGKKIYVGGLPF